MWHDYLIEGDERIREVLHDIKKIAVIGMKDETHENEASYTVPRYLQDHGYEIIPVNPGCTSILGRTCFDNLTSITEPIDAVLVFRSPSKVPPHAKETIELEHKPKVFWMQHGIRNMDAAHKLAAAGIKVVQDHCMYSEHLRLIRDN
ncbi:MAG: CoA-binding protein [Deferribacteres bacterium]|nr:CoA-binding protein [candidate division KSB1 bacterium]MCB9502781.1 CoA-binding protein [Deferribacteres bacterium]